MEEPDPSPGSALSCGIYRVTRDGQVIASFIVRSDFIPSGQVCPESGLSLKTRGRGSWFVSFDVDEAGRRVGLILKSADDPPREVTGALLRDLGTRFGSLTLRDTQERAAFYRDLARDKREDVKVRAKARKLAEREGPKRTGRPRTYDLAKVAEVYADAVARKDPAPVKAVADALGTTRAYASKLVKQARGEKYLPNDEGSK